MFSHVLADIGVTKLVRKIFHRVVLAPRITRFFDWWAPISSLGDRGEREAERYLLKQGLVIVHRNYSDRFGELDLVAVDQNTIVFVEVKTRATDSAGLPIEAVDSVKQRQICETSKRYLKWHGLTECPYRFDVISILWPDNQVRPLIQHYPSAFSSDSKFQIFD
ncbi:MAG: YraN family protein [Planctomycetota bacterium]